MNVLRRFFTALATGLVLFGLAACAPQEAPDEDKDRHDRGLHVPAAF